MGPTRLAGIRIFADMAVTHLLVVRTLIPSPRLYRFGVLPAAPARGLPRPSRKLSSSRDGCPTDVSPRDQSVYPSASHRSPNSIPPKSPKKNMNGPTINPIPHQRGNTLACKVAAP